MISVLTARISCWASREVSAVDVTLKGEIALLEHQVDHPLQPHPAAILRREYLADAIPFDLGDLIRHNHPAAAAKDLDMPFAALPQQIDDVFEEFDMPALIAADRDSLGILLDGRGDDLLDRAVMPQMDHLGAGGLQACGGSR